MKALFPLLAALLGFSLPLRAAEWPSWWMSGVAKEASATTEQLTYKMKDVEEVLPVETAPVLTQADVQKAEIVPRGERPTVGITLTGEGQKKLAELCQKCLNGRMAIGTHNRVLLAPVIREVITNGEIAISGNLTAADAQALVDALNKK